MLPLLPALKALPSRYRVAKCAEQGKEQLISPPADLLTRLPLSDDPVGALLAAHFNNPFDIRRYLNCNRHFFERIERVDLASFYGLSAREQALFDDFAAVLMENAHLLSNCATFTLYSCTASLELQNSLPRLRELRTLSLPQCGLACIDFLVELPQLTALDISGNEIADFTPLSALHKLDALSVRRCGLQSADFLFSLPLLSRLDASENLRLELSTVIAIASRLRYIFLQKTTPLEYFELRIVLDSQTLDAGTVDVEWNAFRMLGRQKISKALKINCATYGVGKVDKKYVAREMEKYYIFKRFGVMVERTRQTTLRRGSCISLGSTGGSRCSEFGVYEGDPMYDRFRAGEVCALLQCIEDAKQ